MTIRSSMRRSLALAATVSVFALASPALADCDVITTTNPGDTLACTVTTTTDTTQAGFPSLSRDYTFNSNVPVFVNVNGAVTGYGLSLRETGGTGAALTFNNNASVTVNAGNTASVGGGNGAVRITTIGSPVTYQGIGSITNLGTGDGLQIDTSGALTAAPITVNTSGAIRAVAGNGVVLLAPTAGSTINATFGSVTTTGAGFTAVRTVTTTGGQTINTGTVTSAGAGLDASSTTGIIVANVTGNVSSTTALAPAVSLNSTGGPVTLNVTGGNVTSAAGNAVRVNAGTSATVNISAGRTVSGAVGIVDTNSAGTLFVNNSGTLTGTTTAIQSAAQTSITNAASGSITGPVLLSGFADTFTNAGTYNVTGASDFGAGSDSFSNTGTVNVAGSTSFANLESFNNGAAGTVNLASGSSLLASQATTFNNAGRINAEAGIVGITTPNFTNAATGILDLQDGATGDVTTITGNYVGVAGSQLNIDAQADLSAADRMVVTGNISGNTTLNVNYLGTAATFNQTGVMVVDGGGTTATGSFTLGAASVNNGLLTYNLRQSGADIFLANNFNSGVTALAPFAQMGSSMWYQSFDAYHDGIAGRHGYRQSEGTPIGLWANLYLSRDKAGLTSTSSTLFGQTLNYSSEIENNRRGAQGGIDVNVAGFTVGATAGYERNKADNGSFAEYNIEGYNYGAYALFGSEVGIYGGVMYKRDDYKIRYFDSARSVSVNTGNARSDGFDGELGYRTTGEDVKFDLNVGVSRVKTDIDPFTLYGTTFSYDDAESLRGRAGVRVMFPQAMGLFVGGKVFHEFKDSNEALTLTSGTSIDTLLPYQRGTTYRVEGGFGADAKGGALLTIWADLGRTKGMGVRAGFRF